MDTARRMDRMYRHQRHIYDLTRKFYLLGRDGLLDRLSPCVGEHVLEIGCGTGRNLIALADRYPGVRLYGVDASAEMLATARHNIRASGHGDRIRLAQGLGENLDSRSMFGLDRRFDAIVISYALTMIPTWPAVVERAADHLRPGGRLAVVDFWDQHDLPGWFRGILQAWLHLFDVRPQREMPDFFRRVTAARGGTLVLDSLFGGYAFRAIYTAPI